MGRFGLLALARCLARLASCALVYPHPLFPWGQRAVLRGAARHRDSNGLGANGRVERPTVSVVAAAIAIEELNRARDGAL